MWLFSDVGMFKGEPGWCSETNEQFREDQASTNAWDNDASLGARRKIERLRELKHLRDLLDDPEFDDLD
jgi:hypothetical protein